MKQVQKAVLGKAKLVSKHAWKDLRVDSHSLLVFSMVSYLFTFAVTGIKSQFIFASNYN